MPSSAITFTTLSDGFKLSAVPNANGELPTVIYPITPGLVASTVIAGVVVALGIGFAGGAALYARGARSASAPVMDRSDDVRVSTE